MQQSKGHKVFRQKKLDTSKSGVINEKKKKKTAGDYDKYKQEDMTVLVLRATHPLGLFNYTDK